jgi:hypothetical protein
MRTYLIVLVAALGCKKSAPAPSTAPARTTAAADALWKLGPENAQLGIIVTPRALALIEGAGLRLQALVDRAPELAMVKGQLDALRQRLGGPFTGLADLGLDTSRGLAWFIDASGEPIVVLPIADRAKFAKVTGEDLGTDPTKLGPMTCKPVGGAQVCTQKPELLATIGKGKLPPAITALGVRGDIEVVGVDDELAGAAVVQLERGELVAHAAVSGVPPQVTAQLAAAKARPRVDPNRTVAFMSAPITLFSQVLPPDLPLPGGGTLGELLATVNGPVSVTIASGDIVPDVRVAVTDPAPAQRLIDHCKELLPADLIAPTQPQGGCRLEVPQYGIELDAWTELHELRLGTKQPAATGPAVTLTSIGKEIADGEWALALWGRGSMYGGVPGLGGQTVPDQTIMAVRGISLVSELGVAVRADGDKVSGVLGLRTLFANPDDVVNKVLAIPLASIGSGDTDAAKAIAAAAPSSPFAADVAAGQGGLMVPMAFMGMLAAVAVPAFTSYMQHAAP